MRQFWQHPIVSFLGGMLVGTFAVGIVGICFFIVSFNLAGGETLQQIEFQNTLLLVTTLLLVLSAAIAARRHFKKGRKYTGYGVSLLPLVAFIIALVYYLDNFTYHKPFDKVTWEKAKMKPLEMAAALVEENKLLGLSRQEVEKKLGPGDENYNNMESGRASISYSVGKEWTLTVYFEKNIVIDAELRLPWLGV